jgi:hypothetical protein
MSGMTQDKSQIVVLKVFTLFFGLYRLGELNGLGLIRKNEGREDESPKLGYAVFTQTVIEDFDVMGKTVYLTFKTHTCIWHV